MDFLRICIEIYFLHFFFRSMMNPRREGRWLRTLQKDTLIITSGGQPTSRYGQVCHLYLHFCYIVMINNYGHPSLLFLFSDSGQYPAALPLLRFRPSIFCYQKKRRIHYYCLKQELFHYPCESIFLEMEKIVIVHSFSQKQFTICNPGCPQMFIHLAILYRLKKNWCYHNSILQLLLLL